MRGRHGTAARLASACVLALALLGFAAAAAATRAETPARDFVLIAHPENPLHSVERRFVAKVFLKDASRWPNGDQIYPVDLPRASKIRDKFSKQVIGRPAAAVRSYWQQRIFSGRGIPPPELGSEAEVIQYVLKYRGAIGYVSGTLDLGKAKVLAIHGD